MRKIYQQQLLRCIIFRNAKMEAKEAKLKITKKKKKKFNYFKQFVDKNL